MKKVFILTAALFFYLLLVFSLHAQEPLSSEVSTASQEILDIADAMESIADRWDTHQNYLNQLMEDLEVSMTDSAELRFTLDRMQETYADLQKDYGLLRVRLQRWKTISLVLGVTSIICVGTLIVLMLN